VAAFKGEPNSAETGKVTLKWEWNVRKTVLVVPRHLLKSGVKVEKIFSKSFFFIFFLGVVDWGGHRGQKNRPKPFNTNTTTIQNIRTYIVAWQKVLTTEKSLVVSFWTLFKFFGNQGELERTETTKNFLLMQEYLSKVNL